MLEVCPESPNLARFATAIRGNEKLWPSPTSKTLLLLLGVKRWRLGREEADPPSRVAGPRMIPSVDVGRPPRPFRHLRMAERRSPDLSSSRAPVHSALVQISDTHYHQHSRSTFNLDAREIPLAWQAQDRKKMAGSLQSVTSELVKRLDKNSVA